MTRALTILSLVTTLTCLASAIGCSDDDFDDSPLPRGFHNSLTETGGCGDILLFASNPEDTITLSFRAEGLVEGAFAEGTETTTDVVLTDTDLGYVVNATTGQLTSADLCTDTMIETPIITSRWRSVSGTVTVTVNPGDTIASSRATAIFEDVTLEAVASAEQPVTIPRFEIIDVGVGWL
jgi:hypothetical protein